METLREEPQTHSETLGGGTITGIPQTAPAMALEALAAEIARGIHPEAPLTGLAAQRGVITMEIQHVALVMALAIRDVAKA